MVEIYPQGQRDRDQWILSRRRTRNAVDPQRPFAFLVEQERSESGEVVPVATVFLTNRECPWRCVMCDLWQNTLTETVPVGAIPAQIDFALVEMQQSGAGVSPAHQEPVDGDIKFESHILPAGSELGRWDACPTLRQIKLYNSGSFFDPQAIPVADYEAIAERVRRFDRVIVECHPALVNERCLRFRDLLNCGGYNRANGTALEVAMGLETAHPDVLEKLNKRMTLDQFARAAEFLQANQIPLRAFILVKLPFLDEAEALHWAKRSLDFAFQCGASVASLIPTRPGNGALDALARQGQFTPPKLATIEASLEYGIALKHGRVFADLWDLERFAECKACFPARTERLRKMNLRQEILPSIDCGFC